MNDRSACRVSRRQFVVLAAGLVVAGRYGPGARGAQPMYGLIGKMTAVAGQRSALIAILLDAVERMPGCYSYIVAEDTADADAIWITEVWDSKDSHARSLTLPEVKAAIAKARPLIAGFADGVTTTPIGGHGLVRVSR